MLPEVVAVEQALDSAKLSKFNPNQDDYNRLRSSGIPKEVAVGIIRWRNYGKVYRVKEDLALVTGMTDSLYCVFEPYIEIADSLVAKPKKYESKSKEYIANPKLKYQKKQCDFNGKSPQNTAGNSLENPIVEKVEKALVEINSADSAALVAVNGIGAKSAAEIMKYRDLLGGFHSVEQISELKCVTEQNFVKILQQICCDSCKIQKIDINFATPKAMARHPYVSARALRKIIKQRQLKGGWSRIEEMVEDEILSEDEAKRLAPYLWFRLDATE